MNKKGFTLVEILIALPITILLLVTVLNIYTTIVSMSQLSKTENQHVIEQATIIQAINTDRLGMYQSTPEGFKLGGSTYRLDRGLQRNKRVIGTGEYVHSDLGERLLLESEDFKIYVGGKNEYKPYEYDTSIYKNVVYVDSEKDGGNGTINSPYKTLSEALITAKSGEAIHLAKGTYEVNKLSDILKTYNVDILGQGLDTVIQVNTSDYIGTNIKNNIFRLVIQPSSTYKDDWNGSYGLILGDRYKIMQFDLEYNNVLFRDPHNKLKKGGRHATYIVADASSGVKHEYKKLRFNNCLSVDMPIVSVWNDGGSPNIEIINSATNVSKIDNPDNDPLHNPLRKTMSLENATIDSKTYEITDKGRESVGLYGGEYRWLKKRR